MLTEAEKQACREARFTGGCGHGYGTPELGLCPAGKVAEMRGAVFTLPPWKKEYVSFTVIPLPDGQVRYEPGESTKIAEQAMLDILAWTGHASWNAFLDDLETHGTAIFPADEVSA